MEHTQEILELFKHYSASEMKSLQTKFTKMGKGIKRDALEGKISAIFTHDQKEALALAANILMNARSSIEHAKEVKERAERERERSTKVAKAKAIDHLKALVVDLTLPQQLSLIFSDRWSVGWPYRDRSVILETVKGERRLSFESAMKNAVSEWVDGTSNSMAWNSLPESWGEPIEVTETSALQRINEATANAKDFQALADEVTQIIKGQEFIDLVKQDLTDNSARKQ